MKKICSVLGAILLVAIPGPNGKSVISSNEYNVYEWSKNDMTNIKCENMTDEIIQDYQQEGFELVFQEYVMEHSLTGIPQIETSLGLTFKSWSSSLEEPFYDIYHASFKDRPGFPGWPMEKWVE
ncbi:hypothetical protein JI667_07320 [Bacillus sp. NTK074B]|uniref:hypothetical protein n=1 Tax=Bacillus sp. NTK074B TaxID=2802174 RepID=UPI001A8C3BC4|nr:hypothetical protein [Bacillus sp. NTK074B]